MPALSYTVTTSTYTATCPTKPADYTGADAVVDELRDLRRDLADDCATVTERQALTNRMLGARTDGNLPQTTGDIQTFSVQGRVHALASTLANVRDSLGGFGFVGSCGSGCADPLPGSVPELLETLNQRIGAQSEPALGTVNYRLAAIGQTLAGTLTTSCAEGCGGAAPADLAPLEATIADARDVAHADLWWVAGLLCALFFGYGLWKAVSPRG